jgi:hypothetical protein
MILPNVLGQARLWMARQVRSSCRDSHSRCLKRMVGLRGFHFLSKKITTNLVFSELRNALMVQYPYLPDVRY